MHMYLFGVLCIVTWSLYCYNLKDSAPKITWYIPFQIPVYVLVVMHLIHVSVVVLLNNLNLSFSVMFLFLIFFSLLKCTTKELAMINKNGNLTSWKIADNFCFHSIFAIYESSVPNVSTILWMLNIFCYLFWVTSFDFWIIVNLCR